MTEWIEYETLHFTTIFFLCGLDYLIVEQKIAVPTMSEPEQNQIFFSCFEFEHYTRVSNKRNKPSHETKAPHLSFFAQSIFNRKNDLQYPLIVYKPANINKTLWFQKALRNYGITLVIQITFQVDWYKKVWNISRKNFLRKVN